MTINVTQTLLPELDDYTALLRQSWESCQLSNNGEHVKTLTENLENFLNIKNIGLVANGTLALQLALKVLGLKGEIITTPFSYVATTTSILWEGCTAIFADIDEKTFCIDPENIEAAITENTVAILATHVFGLPCDVDAIEIIAKKHNLKVIYDAAHAFNVNYRGRSLLEYGDAATLSFHATKLFHTAEGGAVVLNDDEMFQKLDLLKRFGHTGEDSYTEVGINAKMSELHAAMGLAVLPRVEISIHARKVITERYNLAFKKENIETLNLPANLEYNYSYYPILFESEYVLLKVRDALNKQDVFPRRYFYPSLNTLPYLKSRKICPVSEGISVRVLCLPLYESLAQAEQENIISIIKQAML